MAFFITISPCFLTTERKISQVTLKYTYQEVYYLVDENLARLKYTQLPEQLEPFCFLNIRIPLLQITNFLFSNCLERFTFFFPPPTHICVYTLTTHEVICTLKWLGILSAFLSSPCWNSSQMSWAVPIYIRNGIVRKYRSNQGANTTS